jgi:hypothetical protein
MHRAPEHSSIRHRFPTHHFLNVSLQIANKLGNKKEKNEIPAKQNTIWHANHLASVFQPHPPEPDSLPEDTLTSFLETPFQLKPPIQRLKRSEVQNPQGTAHPLHPIPNPALQCYITPRLLSFSMESRPDHTHPEAWQTTSPSIFLPAH